METDATASIVEIGEAFGATEIHRLEDGDWLLVLDDGSAVGVETDAARGVLVLSTDLGHPPEGQELEAYRLLLHATAAWREMGGLRMALDPLDDAVLQLLELPLADLSQAAAREAVVHFTQTARNGRRVIASLGADAAPPPELHTNFVRA
jgi:hypothetical protein